MDQNEIKRLEAVERMRLPDLVVIAGSGVSLYSAGYPKIANTDVASWPGLLRHGLNYCRQHNLLRGEDSDVVELQLTKTSARHLIDAAQQIHDWLTRKEGNSRFFWLKESIGQLKVHDPSLINAISGLGGLIATVNYEDFFEDVTGRPAVQWKDQTTIDEHLERKSIDLILHIHGHWRTPQSIVLDRESYREIANNEKMQGLMHHFARWGTLLFVGCSGTFSDPNFLTLLQWGNKVFHEAKKRHFVLCRGRDEKQLLNDLQGWAMLEPLVYGDEFADLVPFIEKLADDSGRNKGNAPTQQASTASGILKADDILRSLQ